MATTSTSTQTEQATVPSSIKPSTTRGYALTERGAQNIAMGGDIPYPIPQFDDPYKKREWILEHMAAAFRVFARKGFTEGSAGHISVRDPVEPNTFWINPLGIHFGLLKATDMIRVDEDGNVLDGRKGAINAAGFAIHSATHKLRPDVNAACHTHSKYGKTYSCFGKPLQMINQDVCTFYGAHSVYNDFGGVAIEKEEGKRVAESIGNGNSAILMNHGLLTVGGTVDEAAYLFTLMERSCECQLLADAAENAGRPKIEIGEEEAAYTFHMNADPETLYMEFQPDFEMEQYHDNGFMSFTNAKKESA